MKCRSVRWILVLGIATACTSGTVPPPVDAAALQSARITRVELTDEQFADRAARLLVDGQATALRLNDLASVVRHQVRRARRYFDAGHEQAALDAISAAFLLVRAGEFRSEMVADEQQTLLLAAAAVARQGDEGRALAFYGLAQPYVTAPGERRELELHVEALRRWQTDTHEAGTMQGAGARRLAATKLALVLRTPENLQAARQATIDWVERAFSLDDAEDRPSDHFEFDERSEAHRAVLLGAAEMAGLYLRDGDAAGAVSALESEPMSAIANAKLVRRLEEAADGDTSAWADLFEFFQATAQSGQGGIDKDLAMGAAWGTAVAQHRSAPRELMAATNLASLLVAHSMGDVAALLVSDALGDEPDPRALGWSLKLVLTALAQAEERRDMQLARQIFAEGQRMVQLAGSKQFLGRVSPSAAELTFTMGAMESRAGALDQARPLLQSSVRAQPSASSLRLLAAIDRQQGRVPEALGSLNQMLAVSRQQGELASEAATHVMIYDLLRESGKQDQAAASLHTALERALAARGVARSGPEVAATERVLADVLERYGDAAGAKRAVERAGEAGRNDVWQLTATFLDATRRALSMRDLETGRWAMRQALDADLDAEDLVYAALWTQILQQSAAVPSDGAVEEAFARIESNGTWIGALRDWGRGQLDDQQLLARAGTRVERIEAEFYLALRAHSSAPNAATLEALRKVATSEAIELVEVRLARDFVELAKGQPLPTVPVGIVIP